jgi:biotin transporter BioY
VNALRALALRFPLTSMISAIIVWALHFVLVYAVVGLSCERPFTLGRQAAGIWLVAATLVALGAVVAIGLAALSVWRRDHRHSDPAATRRRFMASVAGLLAMLSLIAIIMTVLPVFLLPSCDGFGVHVP